MPLIIWLKKEKYAVVLAALSLVFLFVYSWLYIGSQVSFTSPDETANYTFARQFAENGQLKIHEPLNKVAAGLITPRNAAAVGENIVPASFLGIILIYGLLAKIFGTGIIIFLTPFFSAIAVMFFYLLIKEIFTRQVAFVSSLLLLILPPFWYYASRSMFHNVLFIDLLIVGLFFLVKYAKSETEFKKILCPLALTGIFFGLALITRTSEIFWVMLCLIIMVLSSRQKKKIIPLVLIFIIISLIFLPVLYYNNQLFGSPLSFGYSAGTIDASSGSDSKSSIWGQVSNIIIPFGFDWQRTGKAIYQYLFLIFPWLAIFLAIGLVWFLKNAAVCWLGGVFPSAKKYVINIVSFQKLYLGLYLFILIWLIFYYGSYVFFEYYDQSAVILGSSYLRYWLPIYIFGLPVMVVAIMKIGEIFKEVRVKKLVIFSIVAVVCLLSVNKILADPLQSLFLIKQYNGENAAKTKIIASQTEPGSIIISGYADKIIFPERHVIVGLPGDKEARNTIVKNILDSTSLYYFNNPLDTGSRQIINSLKNSGFEFKQIYYFAKDQEVLYELQ